MKTIFQEGVIKDIIIKHLKVVSDRRGWLGELFRHDELPDGFQPVMGYVSLTHPGVIRGPHEHTEQSDYFCFLGKFTLYLWDNRKGSSTYLRKMIIEDTEKKIVVVPPGVVHAYKNTGDVDSLVLNFPDRLYAGWGRKEDVDEIRYEDNPDTLFKI